jgi:hypothetical protein
MIVLVTLTGMSTLMMFEKKFYCKKCDGSDQLEAKMRSYPTL